MSKLGWMLPVSLLAAVAVGAPAVAQAPRDSVDEYGLVKVGHRFHGHYGGGYYNRRHGHHDWRHPRYRQPYGYDRRDYGGYYRYGDDYRGYRYPPYGLRHGYEGWRYGFDYSPYYGFGLYLHIR